MPAWSTDGTEIAFDHSGLTGIPNLYRMYADGSNETPLTSDLLFNIEPDWFPNGEDRPQQLSHSARHSGRLL